MAKIPEKKLPSRTWPKNLLKVVFLKLEYLLFLCFKQFKVVRFNGFADKLLCIKLRD